MANLPPYQLISILYCCGPILLGAKHDFEIWTLKVFFFDQEKHLRSTPVMALGSRPDLIDFFDKAFHMDSDSDF